MSCEIQLPAACPARCVSNICAMMEELRRSGGLVSRGLAGGPVEQHLGLGRAVRVVAQSSLLEPACEAWLAAAGAQGAALDDIGSVATGPATAGAAARAGSRARSRPRSKTSDRSDTAGSPRRAARGPGAFGFDLGRVAIASFPSGVVVQLMEPVAVAALREALLGAGVRADMVGPFMDAARACAGQPSRDVQPGSSEGPDENDAAEGLPRPVASEMAGSLVERIGVLSRFAGTLDGVVLDLAQELTVANGRVLLGRKRVASPDELGSVERERWRARAKSTARREIAARTGWGAGEVLDLVAVANTPAAVANVVKRGLGAGVAQWRLVRRYYRECSGLAHEDAAAIADALFGFDPDRVVTERLNERGLASRDPWHHREFNRALDREVAKVKARDPIERKAEQERVRASADTWATLDEDGSAVFSLRCSSTQAAAIADRVETAARLARKHGDTRPLGQLRAAITAALLLHSTLNLPDLPDDEALITPKHSDALAAVLHGLPRAVLNVIVPLTSLIPASFRRPDCSCPCTCRGAASSQPPGRRADEDTPGATVAAGGAGSAFFRPGPSSTFSRPGPTSTGRFSGGRADGRGTGEHGADGSRGSPWTQGTAPPETSLDARMASRSGEATSTDGATGRFAAREGPGVGEITGQYAAREDPGTGGVTGEFAVRQGPGIGEVTGKFAHFLDPGAVRELALVPGSTIYRLLTDPASGRCVERSTTSYRFDAAMRAQIRAADVTCRAPGCLTPGAYAQFDHVQEHGTPGGQTREANGALLDQGHHDAKTAKEWDAIIDEQRNITWISLLGKIYRTRAHDYNQYQDLLGAAVDQIQEAPDAERADAVADAIYEALSARPPAARLRAMDDTFGSGFDPGEDFTAWNGVSLTHRDVNGTVRAGPPRTPARPETSQPDSAGPCASTPDSARPDTSQANSRGDTHEPDAPRSSTPGPDLRRPGAPWTGADDHGPDLRPWDTPDNDPDGYQPGGRQPKKYAPRRDTPWTQHPSEAPPF